MADGGERSLTDEDVTSDYRTDTQYIGNLLRQLSSLETRVTDAKGSDQVTMPVEELNSLTMGMRAMVKNQTDLGGVREASNGDRGRHCDYNPFNKIDF